MKIKSLLIIALLAGSLAACNKDDGEGADLSGGQTAQANDPFAMISPSEAPLIAKGKRVGSVTISEDKLASMININVTEKNVMPVGELGITINESGSCAGDNFSQSGGHWNPDKHEHGPNNPKGFHMGDIGNAFSSIGSAMVFKYTSTLNGIGFRNKLTRGTLMDADGFSIVIHEKKDDFKTHPDGGMGKAIACAAFNK